MLPPRPTANFVSHAPIAQVSLLRMGQLSRSSNRRVAILESLIPYMIHTTLDDDISVLSASIIFLATRIEVSECG